MELLISSMYAAAKQNSLWARCPSCCQIYCITALHSKLKTVLQPTWVSWVSGQPHKFKLGCLTPPKNWRGK